MSSLGFHRSAARAAIAASFTAFGAIGGATVAQAADPFVTIDVTGAGTADGQGTFPVAISGKNIVAGYYSDSSSVIHGFFGPATGPFTAFDAPGAGTGSNQGTTALAINTRGDITGSYVDTKAHGFVRHQDGSFDTFSINADTNPTAINNAGTVTGGSDFNGFIRTKKGKATQFSVSGAALTSPLAISVAGVVAGFYYDTSNAQHGFIRAKTGAITTFDAGGIFENTHANSINSNGDVAGYAYSGSTYGGFLRTSDGTVTAFSASTDCYATFPSGINDAGTIAGYCFGADSVYHGFLRKLDGTTTVFSAPNAGTGGGTGTFPTSIAANGRSVGYAEDSSGADHGYRYNGPKK